MKHFTLWKSFLLLCALVVGSNVWGAAAIADGTYSRITNISELTVGSKILMVCESQNKAAGALSTTSAKYRQSVGITISSNSTTVSSSSQITEFTVGIDNSAYTFHDGNGYIKSTQASGANLNIVTTVDNGSKWTVTVSNGVASIKNNENTTRYIKYNSSSPRFACYGSSDQTSISIYKKVVAKTDIAAANFTFVNSTPSVTLSSGTAEYTQTVTKSDGTATPFDGTITYSIDSENSTATATINSSTGIVTATTAGTVKVNAQGTASSTYNDTGVISYTLTVNPETTEVGDIVFSPASGSTVYVGTQISISATNAAFVYYTLDGSAPTDASTDYDTTKPVISGTAGSTITLKTIIWNEDLDDSNTATATYTIKAPEAPTISPASGNVTAGSKATITAADGVTIIYTTNGTSPSFEPLNGDLYDNPIAISDGMTLKAIAVDDAENVSEVASATYAIPNVVTTAATYVFNTIEGLTALGFSTDSGTDLDANADYTSGDVTMNITHGSSTNTRIFKSSDNYDLRVYKNGGSLKFSVPTGYRITKIEIAGSKNLAALSSNSDPENYSVDETGIWTGSAQSVTFAASNTVQINSIDVTYTAPAVKNTVTSALYSTLYYSDKALVVPENAEAYTVKVDGGKLVRSKTYNAGDVIKAGTAVVVKADAATYQFRETTLTGETDENSLLSGTDTEATTTGPDGCKFYKLSLNSSDDTGTVGFYWGAANGAAFTNGAHKAFLVIPAGVELSSKSAILFSEIEEATTSIDTINTQKTATDAQRYNLAGQKVSESYKGIVIVNGKKYINK